MITWCKDWRETLFNWNVKLDNWSLYGYILIKINYPKTLTSFSPCFRRSGLGIENGVYRPPVRETRDDRCGSKDSKVVWKLYKYSVELFLSLDIPVQVIECCSGDLADLKVKSVDVEAWSPRQGKYFEVCSASNLGEAQARRLKIRVAGEEGNYYPHTLNNTVVAPPRINRILWEQCCWWIS